MSKVQHHLCWSSHPLGNAGATFPYPIYAKWADAYKKEIGVGMNYQSIGSGGGIQQIEAKTVTFGATDAPLNGDDLEKNGLVQFPMVIPWQTTTLLGRALGDGLSWQNVASGVGCRIWGDLDGGSARVGTVHKDPSPGRCRGAAQSALWAAPPLAANRNECAALCGGVQTEPCSHADRAVGHKHERPSSLGCDIQPALTP